jgi:hypothetical protein
LEKSYWIRKKIRRREEEKTANSGHFVLPTTSKGTTGNSLGTIMVTQNIINENKNRLAKVSLCFGKRYKPYKNLKAENGC